MGHGCLQNHLGFSNTGKDQKGFHKRGIHDQGDFYKSLLETTVENAQKMRKSDLFMDTPFVDTPFGLAWKHSGAFFTKTPHETGFGGTSSLHSWLVCWNTPRPTRFYAPNLNRNNFWKLEKVVAVQKSVQATFSEKFAKPGESSEFPGSAKCDSCFEFFRDLAKTLENSRHNGDSSGNFPRKVKNSGRIGPCCACFQRLCLCIIMLNRKNCHRGTPS